MGRGEEGGREGGGGKEGIEYMYGDRNMSIQGGGGENVKSRLQFLAECTFTCMYMYTQYW